MYLLNEELSNFQKRKGDKNTKQRKDKGIKRKPGLLSLKRKASYAGHLAKGVTAGALAGGTLAGLAASPVPVLIPAAAGLGAVDGAIKGAVGSSAIYGIRKGLQERKRNKNK